MNLVLKTDVKKTEALLNKYKEANTITGKPGVATSSRSEDPTGLVKGLKKFQAQAPAKAYDPFMGMARTKDMYDLRDDYPSLRLVKAKKDKRTQAGGFDFSAFFDEGLLRAFAGFGCLIEEEKAGGEA